MVNCHHTVKHMDVPAICVDALGVRRHANLCLKFLSHRTKDILIKKTCNYNKLLLGFLNMQQKCTHFFYFRSKKQTEKTQDL